MLELKKGDLIKLFKYEIPLNRLLAELVTKDLKVNNFPPGTDEIAHRHNCFCGQWIFCRALNISQRAFFDRKLYGQYDADLWGKKGDVKTGKPGYKCMVVPKYQLTHDSNIDFFAVMTGQLPDPEFTFRGWLRRSEWIIPENFYEKGEHQYTKNMAGYVVSMNDLHPVLNECLLNENTFIGLI